MTFQDRMVILKSRRFFLSVRSESRAQIKSICRAAGAMSADPDSEWDPCAALGRQVIGL